MRSLTISVVLLVCFLTVGIVCAAELVYNGDFSAGTNGWVPQEGTTFAVNTEACGTGRADARNANGNAGIGQCIHITSPGTDWTLSTDAALVQEVYDDVRIVTDFYFDTACETHLHSEEIVARPTPAPPPVPGHSVPLDSYTHTFTYDTAENGANSVRVMAEISATSGSSFHHGCFDNISLDAPGATLVSTHDLTATGRPILPLIVFAAGLFIGSICLGALLHQKGKQFRSIC